MSSLKFGQKEVVSKKFHKKRHITSIDVVLTMLCYLIESYVIIVRIGGIL